MSCTDPTPTGPDPDTPLESVQGALLMNHQVATLFGVDASTVARWGSHGLITYVTTPGGARRYPAAQFHDLLRETPHTSSVNHTGPLGHADSPGRNAPDGC
ncbi:MerR family DNA-binding transcriptional regulator [Nocardiopsis ansamitocini]|uniref:HTH merR-type domain-containing protein n=1 Tax=Nocardiopsis ansamitocini TaxID=1670832 RepID=A0A9W6UK02_9ACTN|nr:MerR family DNA-binding transcriptional regulator [Nocardiopsis ansamitocini]GLU49038.1 hypothetical protein Nans01_33890 [Nocardiopsis ansamitocini]